MDAEAVLKYGHLWVLKHVEGLTDEMWEVPDVCGVWSSKQILAHLASFEHLLTEVLGQFLDGGPTPTMDHFARSRERFNDEQVARRDGLSPAQVLAEYSETQARTMTQIARIPADTLRQPGTMPRYGDEYALDDFIVYTFYGHKREHMSQIAVFIDQRERGGTP